MPISDDLPRIAFANTDDLWAWLRVHHASDAGRWVVLQKAGSRTPSVTFHDLLEAGIAFGTLMARPAWRPCAATAVPLVINACGAGWRAGYLLLVGVMVVFTLAPAWIIHTRPADVGLRRFGAAAASDAHAHPEATLQGMTFRQAMRSPWFHLFYVMVVLLGVIVAIMQSVSVHLQLLGLTDSIGLYMTILTLGLVFWKIALGGMVDAIGLRRTMAVTMALFVVACLIAPGNAHPVVLVLVMVGMAAGVTNATVVPPLAGAVTFGRAHFTAIWGVAATAISLGTALGTPLWGAVRDATGDLTAAFYTLPGLVVVFLLGMLLAMRRGHASYSTTPAGASVDDPVGPCRPSQPCRNTSRPGATGATSRRPVPNPCTWMGSVRDSASGRTKPIHVGWV